MKTRKNLFALLALVGLAGTLLLTSCEKDEEKEMEMPKNIVEVAVSNPQFSILVQALQKANLATTLQGTGPFTVFAPTNAAFNELFNQLGVSGIDALTADQLTPILLYHVLSGKVESNQLASGYVSTLSPGAGGLGVSLKVDASMLKLNGNVGITAADISATNGVIHVIDKVLLPPTVVDIALANSSFTSLVAALTKANLVNALKADGPFTVFAPTNDAFSQLFTDLGVSGLDALNAEDLTPILLYHVLGAAVKSTQLQTGYVSTLSAGPNDSKVSLLVDAAAVKLNNNSKIVATDVVGTNGIVHVIDKVILPPTVVDIALANSSFSTLVSALVKAELVETLKGQGPFTVFAPTNDAFSALFTQIGVSGIDQLSKDDLTPILLYHVVSGNVKSNQLSSGNVPTLNGDINVNVGTTVTINENSSVVLVDVQATNGVIHVINKVLLPPAK
ncbi:MAG: fasciclin domain-containing protein [Tenuifilum sp.]|uniref:fasciclin domain-containing protein n=1 Tax=Tenuifilum sp. TaxID=2760880 RepID=UPI0030A30B1C